MRVTLQMTDLDDLSPFQVLAANVRSDQQPTFRRAILDIADPTSDSPPKAVKAGRPWERRFFANFVEQLDGRSTGC